MSRFGDIDPITLREVSNSIKKINAEFGTTIILVSHHVDFVKEVSHRAILIENGSLVADGIRLRSATPSWPAAMLPI